jgi:ppGpp synthetase/RelA/SpoT-type nucleotidyltranferase
MNYRPSDLNRVVKNLTELIEKDLGASGLFYRIFSRVKSPKSLKKKLGTTDESGNVKYDGLSKSLRDIIGIRINLYFVDDQKILLKYLKEKYRAQFLEEAVDILTDTEFRPSRVNMIFRLPQEFQQEFRSVIPDIRVDATFELQLRTVFSEGWHEVEHDFRYKCPDDWKSYTGLSRTFNGMLAAVETHEWGMIKLFEELSYSHYKSANYSAMIRMHLRIRIEDNLLSEDLSECIGQEGPFIKDFFKLERGILIDFLLKQSLSLPFTVDNLLYLINFFFIRNSNILLRTPDELASEFKQAGILFDEII